MNEWVVIGDCRLYCGKAEDILPALEPQSVDAVITSPPYADQREGLYPGVPAHRYPWWTATWALACEHAMSEKGSILINIREHVSGGQLSDYVHKTRLLLREVGLNECDELIWCKPNAPPLGHPGRFRRSWERVLWFSFCSQPFCNPMAGGKFSARERWSGNGTEYSNAGTRDKNAGMSRSADYQEIALSGESAEHPAPYPVRLARWLVDGFSKEEDTVCDPFMGSGTTGKVCAKVGRQFIGIEREPKYFNIACKRIEEAVNSEPLFK